jgi:hypothetical protein
VAGITLHQPLEPVINPDYAAGAISRFKSDGAYDAIDSWSRPAADQDADFGIFALLSHHCFSFLTGAQRRWIIAEEAFPARQIRYRDDEKILT